MQPAAGPWCIAIGAVRSFIGQHVGSNPDGTHNLANARECFGVWGQDGIRYTKDFRIMPIIPFDSGVTLRGVGGPLIMVGPDIEKVHPMIVEAFAHCLAFEAALSSQTHDPDIIDV